MCLGCQWGGMAKEAVETLSSIATVYKSQALAEGTMWSNRLVVMRRFTTFLYHVSGTRVNGSNSVQLIETK